MVIRIKDLSFRYAKQKILREINLHIEKGDFIGIIGPNGSGKTTLLKNISRLLQPTKGAVLVEERPVQSYSSNELAKKMGVLPQNPNTEFKFTVQDIVLMGRNPHLTLFQEAGEKDLAIAEEAMKETNTYRLRDSFIDEISSGEKQRVFIAQTLAKQPQIILLDEPTSHLDMSHETEIFNLLKKLNQEKQMTIITTLHDLNLAAHYAGKLVLLDNGKIYAKDKIDEVLTKENIEKVYRTKVSIKKDPETRKPIVRPIRD